MAKKVAVMPGDGIGPEVAREAARVMEAMAQSVGMQVETTEVPIGGSGYDAAGDPLPAESLEVARQSDAILLGAVGGPKWDTVDFALRPEAGLLRLRAELDLYANLRPAMIFAELAHASTLKSEVVEGCDLMVLRELTGGIYFGQPRGVAVENGVRVGRNTLVYSEPEIERIVRSGFEIASRRSNRLCSVDKANVLEVSILWREVANRIGKEYPHVELSHMYVDNAAMQLIRNPKQFDTIVTTNMFGDILSDAAAMITGSIGMLPSASIGDKGGLYEPVHGSAPDIAGQDKANPLAAILSVGMMFRYTFDMPEVDAHIQSAVRAILANYRTVDIMESGKTEVGCTQMGDLILEHLAKTPVPMATPAAR